MIKTSPKMTQDAHKNRTYIKATWFNALCIFYYPSVLLVLVTIAGCASQTEMLRMQGQVVELQKQLVYEKQRLKQATEKTGPGADQHAGQPPP